MRIQIGTLLGSALRTVAAVQDHETQLHGHIDHIRVSDSTGQDSRPEKSSPNRPPVQAQIRPLPRHGTHPKTKTPTPIVPCVLGPRPLVYFSPTWLARAPISFPTSLCPASASPLCPPQSPVPTLPCLRFPHRSACAARSPHLRLPCRAVLCSSPDAAAGAVRPEPQAEMSSRNRSAASCAAPAAAPSLRTPRRLRRRPVKAAAPGPGGGGRRSGPATPLLKWDVGGRRGEGTKAADEAGDAARARETKAREVSVRRLAAGVWRLRPPEAVAGAGAGGENRVRVGVEVCHAALLQHLLPSYISLS
jgi:hypothetical protein